MTKPYDFKFDPYTQGYIDGLNSVWWFIDYIEKGPPNAKGTAKDKS